MKKIFFCLSLALVTISLFFSSLVLASPLTITSMNDLPYLDRETEGQAQAQSIFRRIPNDQQENIVILYDESQDNNIGKLGLEAEDFCAGVTVSDRVDVLRTAEGVNADEVINEISEKGGVLAVSKDGYQEALSLPNDPLAPEEYYFTKTGADQIWSNPGTEQVKVALIDSGVDPTHEDLINRVDLTGKDLLNKEALVMKDTNGHGTGVASVIAAETNNGLGMTGIVGACDVKLVPYRVIRDDSYALISDISAAIIDASQRPDIRVINMSLGGNDPSAVEESACQVAYNAGKILVAPTGNQNEQKVNYPAAFDTVIAVGSVNELNERCTDQDWGRRCGSNFGSEVELMAPGNNIVVASPLEYASDKPYSRSNGTSFSSPMVAGACALLLANDPTLTAQDVRDLLISTADDIGMPGKDDETGYGSLRIDKAVLKIQEKNPETKIKIVNSHYDLVQGQTRQVDVLKSSNSALTWSSDNPAVASVDPSGVVTALSPGSATITVQVDSSPADFATCTVQVTPLEFSYNAQVENIGWMPAVGNNGVAGTLGQNLKLETLKFNLPSNDLGITAQVHVENVGTMQPVPSGQEVGTVGFNQGIESFALNLTGDNSANFTVYYRAYVENHGWTAWASNGQWCGTQGLALQLEAVQVYVAPNGTAAPQEVGDVNWMFAS